ncbi:MAG: phosphatase PAP2 family protein [Jatrophihabitans sp.]|uniref:phosphatase PAP2 family protein n=1 Tax=Jatrophihabitans sp. TaxID=1932789 RepID=UPI003F82035C
MARRLRVHARATTFGFVLTLYVAITVAVVVGWSPLEAIDRWARTATLTQRHSGARRFALDYVMLGQRAPITLAVTPYVLWLCRRRRSLTPALRLAVALILLNLSVGAVKLAIGRWGPWETARVHDVLAGGDIYPSGHVSNAVVVFGVLASLAVQRRRLMTAMAVWVAVTVGVGTVYLDFHWVTDVLGGLLAGSLVLLAVPTASAPFERFIASNASRVSGAARGRPPEQSSGRLRGAGPSASRPRRRRLPDASNA